MKLSRKSITIIYPGFIVVSSMFLLVYVVLNAVRVSFSHDEAITFLNYLSGDIFQLFNFISPNNHFLNTVLAKISYFFGGNKEWVLRLPNVLAYVLYLVFSFRLVHAWTRKPLAAAGFLLLNLNPYVLDFFSLCRGYGLSMGFMVAALFFYVSFLDKTFSQHTPGSKDLSWSLGLAACACLANLALLNVYIGLAIFTIGLYIILNRKSRRTEIILPGARKPSMAKNIYFLAFALFSLFFNIVLVGQDIIFSERFTEPVTVKVSDPPANTAVYGISLFHGEVPFVYQDGLWTFKQEFYLSAIRLRIPLSSPDKIEALEVRIGPRTFQVNPEQIQKWRKDQNNRYRFLYSDDSIALKRATFAHLRSVINWGGDRPFYLSILGRFAFVAALFAVLFGLVLVLVGLFDRRKILTKEQLHPLVSASFMLVSLVAYPVYLFGKYQAFVYWESDKGFFQDTILSLIRSSLYGQGRSSGLAYLIFSLVLLSFVLFLVLCFFFLRQKAFSKIRISFFLMALLFISALSTVGQNILFQTPYLYERTAVFFIPLFMLFLIFLIQSLADSHPKMKIPVASLLVVVTVLSLIHFSQTSSTLWVQDWKTGADTKGMLQEIRQLREKDSVPPDKLRLGIHWLFSPAISYYRMKENMSWLEFGLVDKPGQIPQYDYCYLTPELIPDKAFLKTRKISIVKRYKNSGNYLLKVEKTTDRRGL